MVFNTVPNRLLVILGVVMAATRIEGRVTDHKQLCTPQARRDTKLIFEVMCHVYTKDIKDCKDCFFLTQETYCNSAKTDKARWEQMVSCHKYSGVGTQLAMILDKNTMSNVGCTAHFGKTCCSQIAAKYKTKSAVLKQIKEIPKTKKSAERLMAALTFLVSDYLTSDTQVDSNSAPVDTDKCRTVLNTDILMHYYADKQP